MSEGAIRDGLWSAAHAERAALVKSVSDGRHGLCPAWIDKLSPADVRELAVYLHQLERGEPEALALEAGDHLPRQRPLKGIRL